MIHIAPSLLSADLLQLKKEVEAVLHAGASMIHLDVMDNHYVPNLTFGPDFCRALRQSFPEVCLDVHLMVQPVEALIDAFVEAGASRISIHPDACIHLNRELARIRHSGCKAGLALNPATSLDCLNYTHTDLDFVLVMSVNPGFGGQVFIPNCLSKIEAIHKQYPHLEIAVDGGVNVSNIAQLAHVGATTFITGSALFYSSDYVKTIAEFKKQVRLHP